MKMSSFGAIAVILGIAAVALAWYWSDPALDSVHTPPDRGSAPRAASGRVDPEPDEVRVDAVPAPAQMRVFGTVVTVDGNPVQAKITIKPDGEAGGAGDRSLSTDESGRFEARVPRSWAGGCLFAESLDQTRRGKRVWVSNADGDTDLGQVVVELSPRVVLHLHIAPEVSELLQGDHGYRIVVDAERAGTKGVFAAASSVRLHEFALGREASQTATVEVSEACLDERSIAKLLWRFEVHESKPGIPLLLDEVDALRGVGAESTLHVEKNCLLIGKVESAGRPLAQLVLTALILADPMFSGSFVTAPDGQFFAVVPPGSKGLVWPNTLGQAAQSSWKAGEEVVLRPDLDGLELVSVIDASGQPVQRCKIATTNRMVGGACSESDGGWFLSDSRGQFFVQKRVLESHRQLFVSVPGSPEMLCELDSPSDAGGYRVDLGSARTAGATLRVLCAREGGSLEGFNVLLEGGEREPKVPMSYGLYGLAGQAQSIEFMFAGTYEYVLRNGTAVVEKGTVRLDDEAVATIEVE